jgi:hypothetical protein
MPCVFSCPNAILRFCDSDTEAIKVETFKLQLIYPNVSGQTVRPGYFCFAVKSHNALQREEILGGQQAG